MAQKKQKQKAKRKESKQNGFTLEKILSGFLEYDNVLIRPIIDDTLKVDGVEIARPQNYEDKPEWGEVLMIGEGRIFDNGTVIPLQVKKGSLVYFQKYSSQKLRVEGEDLLIIREEDIYWHD